MDSDHLRAIYSLHPSEKFFDCPICGEKTLKYSMDGKKCLNNVDNCWYTEIIKPAASVESIEYAIKNSKDPRHKEILEKILYVTREANGEIKENKSWLRL